MDTRVPPASPRQGFDDNSADLLAYETGDDKGISVVDILFLVWHRRGVVFAGTMLGLLIGLAAALFIHQRTSSVSLVEYFISLSSISNSKYPNGTDFSPQDLLSPEVLNIVAEQVGVESGSKLRPAVSAEFNSPDADGITLKYREQLKGRGLSATEIETLNRQYTEEIERATAGSVRLAINTAEIGINQNMAREAMIHIPAVWSQVYTSRFRILDDRRLQTTSIVLDEDIHSQIGAINADRKLDTLKAGLALLANDNRLSSLEANNGNSPADLIQQINDFMEVYLSPILVSRLSKDDFLTRFYTDGIGLKIREIDTEQEGIGTTVADIQRIMVRQPSPVNASTSSPNGSPVSSLDLDGSALDTIVELANRASLTEHLTKLFDRRQELVGQRAALATRMNRISGVVEVDDRFITQAQGRLEQYFKTYNELVSRAREIVRSEAPALYRPIGEPMVLSAGSALHKILTVVIATLLGLLLSLVVVMLTPRRATGRKVV